MYFFKGRCEFDKSRKRGNFSGTYFACIYFHFFVPHVSIVMPAVYLSFNHTLQVRKNMMYIEKISRVWYCYSHIHKEGYFILWKYAFCLTLNVRGPSYLGLTRSISWLLMPWLLTLPGHQQPWYWLYRICRSFSYLRKDFKYLCQINVEEWHKMQIYVYIPCEKFSM